MPVHSTAFHLKGTLCFIGYASAVASHVLLAELRHSLASPVRVQLELELSSCTGYALAA